MPGTTEIPGLGRAYLIDGPPGQPLLASHKPSGKLGELFGSAVAADGDLILVGAPLANVTVGGLSVEKSGAAYLFDATAGQLLRRLENPTPHQNDQFGF